jgi:hypothetical protein
MRPPIDQPDLPPHSERLQILVADQGMVLAVGREIVVYGRRENWDDFIRLHGIPRWNNIGGGRLCYDASAAPSALPAGNSMFLGLADSA